MSSGAQKVAIVTGGATGIGAAIADRFAKDGYCVVIADVHFEAASATATRIAHGSSAVHCDVSDEASVTALFQSVKQTFKQIDVVVNNAGIIRDKMIWKMTPEEFDLVIRVNLRGTWLMCREAAIVMHGQGFGSIVNITSRAWLGNPGQTNYSSSKAGVVGLTRSLALELGPHHVRVNAVAPGLIDTPLSQSLREDVLQRLIQAQPTRTMGQPSDVADVVAFLASDESRFMTGQVLYVDGGKSIGAGL